MALWSHSSGCFLVLLTLCFAGNKQMPYNCPIKPNKLYPKLNVYIIYLSVPSAIHAHTFLKAYSIQPNTYFLSYMSKHLGTHSYNSYGRKGTSLQIFTSKFIYSPATDIENSWKRMPIKAEQTLTCAQIYICPICKLES